VAIAIVTKLAGCGIPSIIFLKNKSKAMRVGVGMISRGEVGLIIAGVGVSSGVLALGYLYFDNYHGCCYYDNCSHMA
jgi:Kef-type K+ transport system membrane component KefB